MGRKKRNGMKMPPRGFKKFLPKEKVKRMASRDDLARIDQDLHAVRMEAKSAVDKFNDYARAVTGQIKEILDEAGVFEEVSAIEKSRDDVRKTLEMKLKGLQEKVNELLKIRAYLDSAVKTAPAPVEGVAPAPVAEVAAPVEEASVAPVAPVETEAVVAEAPAAPVEKKAAKGSKKEKAAPAPAAPVEEPAPAPAKKDRKPVEPPKF